MQPAGQSPQPIRTVTAYPGPLFRASYELPWPMRPGSRGPRSAKRGSWERTRATASCSVGGPAADVGRGDGDPSGAFDSSGETEPPGAAVFPGAVVADAPGTEGPGPPGEVVGAPGPAVHDATTMDTTRKIDASDGCGTGGCPAGGGPGRRRDRFMAGGRVVVAGGSGAALSGARRARQREGAVPERRLTRWFLPPRPRRRAALARRVRPRRRRVAAS